jgi:acyl carrier protein
MRGAAYAARPRRGHRYDLGSRPPCASRLVFCLAPRTPFSAPLFPPIAEVHMPSVREKLNEIIAEFAGVKTEDVAKADALSQIEVDSITMLGIVDEIEEHFGIKIDVAGDFNFDMTMNDFVALIDGLVAKKNA